MNRGKKRVVWILVIILALFLAAFIGGQMALRSFFYPKPPSLPPIVAQSTAELLVRLQTVLEQQAPETAKTLQPGLTDAQISALEKQGGFRLSEDFRALYRWHNGSTRGAHDFLSGQRFVPLDEIVSGRAAERDGAKSATFFQRAVYSILAGHRKTWLNIFDDGAGDGYFYDYARSDKNGAFFYNFAEDSSYVWFPSLRNFLAGAIEGYETGAFYFGTNTSQIKDSIERSNKIWNRLGQGNHPSN